jgi:hypothetical protein
MNLHVYVELVEVSDLSCGVHKHLRYFLDLLLEVDTAVTPRRFLLVSVYRWLGADPAAVPTAAQLSSALTCRFMEETFMSTSTTSRTGLLKLMLGDTILSLSNPQL